MSPGVRRALAGWWPVATFALLGFVWLVSSPPGSAPDEISHYIKMVGTGRGDPIGADVPLDTPQVGFTPDQLARVNSESGAFRIPGFLQAPIGCNAFHAEIPFACAQPPPADGDVVEISPHGRYLPLAYVLPGVLTHAATTTFRAVLLGRLGFLVQATALLAVAVAAMRALQQRWTAAGAGLLVLSCTPLLTYQAGTLAPNGTETLAVVAFVASLVASARLRDRRWWWIAALVGTIASWSRDLGAPLLAVLLPAVAMAVPEAAGWARERLRSRDVWAVVLLGAGIAGAIAWQVALKYGLSLSWDGPGQLWTDLRAVRQVSTDSIGLLGWLDLPMDPLTQTAWEVAWVASLVVVLARVPRRARWLAAYIGAAYVGINLALLMAFRDAGFGVQARFTIALPIALALLLACVDAHDRAAETAAATAPRSRVATSRWWFWTCCAVAAVGHLVCVLQMAHRQANGIGQPIDFARPAWSPPGGWWFTFALATVAAVALALTPVLLRPDEPAGEMPP